jgi:hypothetical protein
VSEVGEVRGVNGRAARFQIGFMQCEGVDDGMLHGSRTAPEKHAPRSTPSHVSQEPIRERDLPTAFLILSASSRNTKKIPVPRNDNNHRNAPEPPDYPQYAQR